MAGDPGKCASLVQGLYQGEMLLLNSCYFLPLGMNLVSASLSPLSALYSQCPKREEVTYWIAKVGKKTAPFGLAPPSFLLG